MGINVNLPYLIHSYLIHPPFGLPYKKRKIKMWFSQLQKLIKEQLFGLERYLC